MPRRRYRKRPYKRKRNYKRKKSYLSTKGKGLNKSFPLSKSFKYQTRYVEDLVNLDPGIGGVQASYVFNLMSLFDPNYTGTGHQPLGFDQIMPLYDHYTVVGARARVTCTNTDSTIAQRMILQVKDTATSSTNASAMIENGNSVWTVLSPKEAGGCTKTLSINFSPKAFFGKSPMHGDKYQGTISSSPVEGAFLHIAAEPMELTDVGPVRCTVVIEYISILTEPKQLTQS